MIFRNMSTYLSFKDLEIGKVYRFAKEHNESFCAKTKLNVSYNDVDDKDLICLYFIPIGKGIEKFVSDYYWLRCITSIGIVYIFRLCDTHDLGDLDIYRRTTRFQTID